MDEKLKSAPIEKFLKVMAVINGNIKVTPELLNELIGIAARLEEIEVQAKAEG